MVMKRGPGRPPAYDRQLALNQAMDLFWAKGLGNTSLDEVATVTGMNRPSLAAAFGSKEDLYLAALELYADNGVAGLQAALSDHGSLRSALMRAYSAAIQSYMAGDAGPRGCLLIGTAGVEAVHNERVRRVLHHSLKRFTDVFVDRFDAALESGQLPAGSDKALMAELASSLLHSLAVRARSGEGSKALTSFAEAAVAMLVPDLESRQAIN